MYGGVSQTGRLIDYEAKVSRTVPGEGLFFHFSSRRTCARFMYDCNGKLSISAPRMSSG